MDALGRDLVDLGEIHLFEHLDARLDLLGFGGLVAETLDEGLDLGDLALLVGEGGHLRGAPFLHEDDIVGIGGLIVVDAAGGYLDGAGGDVVEESAVVRDEDDGAGIGGEEGLEPLDGDDVEVVGRFVEEKEVRMT